MFNELWKNGSLLEKYIVSRWFYKIGKPIIEIDEEFDLLEDEAIKQYGYMKLFTNSYENDEKPVDLLNKFNISLEYAEDYNEGTVCANVLKYDKILKESTRGGIYAIRNYEEAYEWFKLRKNLNLIFLLKVDGINTRIVIEKATGDVCIVVSRAEGLREVQDYTSSWASKGVMKFNTKEYEKIDNRYIVFYSEGYLNKEGIERLNKEYGENYKNERSAGISALSCGLPDDLVKYLKFITFRCEDDCSTLGGSLERIEKLGLQTPPYRTDYNRDLEFDDFKIWIDNIIEGLLSVAEEESIPYDGVVVQVNDWDKFNELENEKSFNSNRIALKLGKTSAEILETIVTDLQLSYNGGKDKFSVTLFIEPVTPKDNKTITQLSGYNLGYIQNRNIGVGSKIKIIYQSGCYPVLKGDDTVEKRI